MTKRIFDLLLALASLPLAVPAIAICAVAIKLTSPGPAILRQVRIGRHEKPFLCFKLRTMYTGTRSAPTHETPSSSVTPVGKHLRRLKLDELPQLWNIIRGEMSFVGPRPCLPSQLELIAARRERGVYSLRPGITGVAQVKGVDMSVPQKLAELDAKYLENESIATDLRLILMTALGAGRGDRILKSGRDQAGN